MEGDAPISMSDLPAPIVEPTPPPTISLADILSATEIVMKKEEEDKNALNGIGSITFDTLKSSLIRWASVGFPNAYTIHEIPISVPEVCSDGVKRSLADYIVFVSGKSIQEHVAGLQQRVLDIDVSFAYTGSSIPIVVSKRG